MKRVEQVLITVVGLALAGNLALAQTPANSVEGRLIRVDSESMTLVVTGSDGSERQFKYDTTTEVTGTQRGIADLPSRAGTDVVVSWTDDVQVEEGEPVTRIDIKS